MSDAPIAPTVGFPAELPYKILNAHHPEYCGAYLRRLKAFYRGGHALLCDSDLMADVFPQHFGETSELYAKRKSHAVYLTYAAEILNFVASSMGAEALTVGRRPERGTSEAPEVDEWWADWFDDVSPSGGKDVSIHDYVKAAILDALQCRVSWHRVDLPNNGGKTFVTLEDQDRVGARNAFVVPVPAECVIDWEEDESGELTMAVVHSCERKRASIASARDMVTDVWKVYTREGWARYEKTHKEAEKLSENAMIPRVKEGTHTFGAVQLQRLDVGDGLWAMDNIESVVREHFNLASAAAWARLQCLYPELYEFLGPEMSAPAEPVIGENQKDADRATSQPRGLGFVQKRGKDDKAGYVGPPPDSFVAAREDLADLRTEIHRVIYLMALAVDNSAAALRRSADSKGQDKASAMVVFQELGQIARRFTEKLCDVVAKGRGEDKLVGQWQAKGMGKFDAVSLDSEIKRATDLENVRIPSPTFQKRYKFGLAKTILGDEATPEDIEAIEDELEENITAESMEPLRPMPDAKLDGPKGKEEQKPGGETEDGEDTGGDYEEGEGDS